jgi:hypothetical protein
MLGVQSFTPLGDRVTVPTHGLSVPNITGKRLVSRLRKVTTATRAYLRLISQQVQRELPLFVVPLRLRLGSAGLVAVGVVMDLLRCPAVEPFQADAPRAGRFQSVALPARIDNARSAFGASRVPSFSP